MHDKHLVTIKYHYWLVVIVNLHRLKNIVMWILQILPKAFTNLNWLDQNNPCWKTWNDRPFFSSNNNFIIQSSIIPPTIINWESVKKQVQGHKQGPWQVLNSYWVFLPCRGVSDCLGTLMNTEECKQQASGLGGNLCPEELQWGGNSMTLYFIKLYKNGIILKIWNINKEICKHYIVTVIIILTSWTESRF